MSQSSQPYEVSMVDRIVGLTVLIMVVLVLTTIVLRYQKIGLGEKLLDYHTLLNRSYGIAPGSDIRISGIAIGTIGAVNLQRGGGVRVDIGISSKYREFVTQGSHLEIGSSMGLAAMIGSTGLDFVSNEATRELLEEGAEITTIQPVELGETFSDDEIRKVAENIKTLIENLRQISDGIDRNQELIASSIEDIGDITQDIRRTTETLPGLINTVESGFATWQRAGQSVYDVVEGAGDDIIASSSNIRGSSDRLDQILAELQTLSQHARLIVQRLDSGTEELPDLISEGHSLIKNTNEITDRISNHWLLGGDATGGSIQPLPGLHPHDPGAYDAAADTPAPGLE
jgi:ABC-type transporter Mla subunit MlaD